MFKRHPTALGFPVLARPGVMLGFGVTAVELRLPIAAVVLVAAPRQELTQ